MSKLFFIARLGMVLLCLSCWALPSSPHAPRLATADLPIYADALAGGWQDWSWIPLATSTTPTRSQRIGFHRVTYTVSYGACTFIRIRPCPPVITPHPILGAWRSTATIRELPYHRRRGDLSFTVQRIPAPGNGSIGAVGNRPQ